MSRAAPPVLYDLDDFVALARRGRHRLFAPLLGAAAVLLVVIILLMTMAWLVSGRLMLREMVATFVALIAFLLIVSLTRLAPLLMIRASRRAGQLVEQRFTILDEGFQAESSRGTTLTRWAAVHGVEEDGGRLFVAIAPRLAYVVPRRVFADNGAFADFVADARARWQAARP